MTSWTKKLRSGEPLTDGERLAIAEALEAGAAARDALRQENLRLRDRERHLHKLAKQSARYHGTLDQRLALLLNPVEQKTDGDLRVVTTKVLEETIVEIDHLRAALAAARAKALEEAAELAERYGDTRVHKDVKARCYTIAAAIRALKEPPS